MTGYGEWKLRRRTSRFSAWIQGGGEDGMVGLTRSIFGCGSTVCLSDWLQWDFVVAYLQLLYFVEAASLALASSDLHGLLGLD
jgi:hypothetical protein